MTEVQQLRNQQINNFVSQFDDLKDLTVDEIKDGLRNILGETPAVEFEYGVDYLLNEATEKEERKHELKKINIFYSYFDLAGVPKISKLSYIVG
jgi:hypothetical protein